MCLALAAILCGAAMARAEEEPGDSTAPAAPRVAGPPDSLVLSVTRDSLRILHLDFRAWESDTQYECEMVILPDHPGVGQPSRGTLWIGDSLSYAIEPETATSNGKRTVLYRFGVWKQWIEKARFTMALETGRRTGIRRVVYFVRPSEFLFGR